MEIIT